MNDFDLVNAAHTSLGLQAITFHLLWQLYGKRDVRIVFNPISATPL